MREFFDRLQLKIADFMQGRYGMDDLNRFLTISALLIIVLTMFIPAVSFIGWILIAFMVVRALSKNPNARVKENEKYKQLIKRPQKIYRKIDRRWTNRKTTVYFKCKGCGQELSLPKGKGNLRVICPKCGKEIFKTT